MNVDNLYDQNNNEYIPFVDSLLTLTDKNNKITIATHKIILYNSCIYFKKMLTNFKEKDSNSITIQVPNVNISYDIIISFYHEKKIINSTNYPIWKYQLESYKCYDFFGLDFLDTKIFFDLEIPDEGFELLLDVIELIGFNKETIKLLNKNIPDDYDLTKFPKELLNEMYMIEKTRDIILASFDGRIRIWNNITNKTN